ncbi:Peroxidase 13 [Linum perenne]
MLCFRSNPLFLIFFHTLLLITASNGQLQFGFYANSCPPAEEVVFNVVREANNANPNDRTAAKLLRLSFHDCFVEGCDGSILLNGGERGAFGNQGLGAFEVIEKAKERLEDLCPGVVSCADIVALAARDAVALSHGPVYNVQTGRRDGRITDVNLAANLPDVTDSAEVLIAKFREKGLSVKDLVLLSAGGHTIGTTACFFVTRRLYNFTDRLPSDPAINPRFLPQLKSKCPFGGNVNDRLDIDWSSAVQFDDSIVHNIRNGFAVLASDARLTDNRESLEILESYVNTNDATSFIFDFADAMVNMGTIGVKTGNQGEIRRRCSVVN